MKINKIYNLIEQTKEQISARRKVNPDRSEMQEIKANRTTGKVH